MALVDGMVDPNTVNIPLWRMNDGSLAKKVGGSMLVYAVAEQSDRMPGEDVTEESMFEPANELAAKERLPLVSGGDASWT